MVGLIAAGAYLALLLLRTALALTYLRRFSPAEGVRMEEVSVLQPILSGDPGLEKALRDNVEALPRAAFLWLVDQDDDVGREVAARLQRPDIRIIDLPPAPEGVNPKLFKLEAAWREARTPVLVVLDDDTRLPARSLDALVGALDHAELSTGLPHYRPGKTFAGKLLAQFVNDNAALTYLALPALRAPVTINGMGYAIRRETLERIGGFEPLLRHLTDDLAVARHVMRHGGKIRQTSAPLEVETGIADLGQYARQMHRWFLFALLLVRAQPPDVKLTIGLLQGVSPWLLWTAIVSLVAAPSPALGVGVAVVFGIRCGIISWLQARLTGRVRVNPALSLLSELLQPFHLLRAACCRNIRWRSRRYRVYDNDRFEAI
jgi:ceramide glucosyltransferase